MADAGARDAVTGGIAAPEAGRPGDGATSPPAADPPAKDTTVYACTEINGVDATRDWFEGGGFEKLVDGARWQLRREHGIQVYRWGNPKDPVWSVPPLSPCAAQSAKPDRAILATRLDSPSAKGALTSDLIKVIATFKERYPGIKRIELWPLPRPKAGTMCPDKNVWHDSPAPWDAAIREAAASDPATVRVGPIIEILCAMFKDGLRLEADGAATVAKAYAELYGP